MVDYSINDNQRGPWRYSYIVVKSIKEFATQTLHLGLLVLIQLPQSLASYQHHRAFSMDEALGYLRQVSLLVGCHGLNACVLPKFICGKPNPQSDDIRRWDHWKDKVMSAEHT